MSAAKVFNSELLETDFVAKMSKHDLCNAYKIVLAHPSTWRYNDFSWLSKFSIDRKTFGSKAVPAQFALTVYPSQKLRIWPLLTITPL
jgi:hypothetical protein